MIAFVLIVVMCAAIMQEAEAYHCADERKAAADAYDAWDTTIIALGGASALWVSTCVKMKTVRDAVACAGASLALAAAVAYESSYRNKAASADTAFYDCLREHSNSGG